MKFRTLYLYGLALLVAACSSGGGGGDSDPVSYNVTFEPPAGADLASGQVNGLYLTNNSIRNFEFTDGVVVTGTVTDGGGAPMAGVEVSFSTSANSPSMDDDTTDGLGVYSVRLSAATWMATLDSDSALGEMVSGGLAVVGPGPVTMDFQFPAMVAVTGTVFEFGGPAIAAAELEFRGAQTDSEVSVTADGLGDYTANLVPDTYDVIVMPDGAPAATHLGQVFHNVVVTGATVQNFDLMAGVQLTGIVLDALGMPLLEASEIDIILPDGSDFFAPSDVEASEVDGTYSIGPVPFGSVTIRVEADSDTGYPRQELTRTIVGPVAQMEDLQLSAGVVLSGTVLMDTLVAIENCEVRAIPVNGSLEPDDDDTDGVGFYEISLFPGTYDIEFEPDEPDDLQLPETVRVTIAAATTLDHTLTAGAILTGTVLQPGGVMTEDDATVSIEGVAGADDETDSGVYSFLAPIGMHDLTIDVEDGLYEAVAMEDEAGVVVAAPGPVTHDFTMVPKVTGSTTVSGIVYGSDGVTPVVGAEIVARRNGEVIGRTISLPGGTYVLVVSLD